MTSPSAVQDKNPKPPGLLPKNVQSWLLIGLAVVMVLIMWLTGGKKPPTPARSGPPLPVVQAPLEVNEAKIVDLQNRIQQLQREQIIAQNALAQQSRALGNTPDPPLMPNGAASAPQERAEDSIREERKKRDYLSLFASNVALSYQKNPESVAHISEPAAAQPVAQAEPAATQLAELLKPLQASALSPSVPPTHKESAADSDRKEDQRNPVATPAGAPAAATGKTYVLFEGTILESLLINRLDGQFSGPVEMFIDHRCLLTRPSASPDSDRYQDLGEARSVETFGQTRLAVAFHRLVMPDGYSTASTIFKASTRSATPVSAIKSTTTICVSSVLHSPSARSAPWPKRDRGRLDCFRHRPYASGFRAKHGAIFRPNPGPIPERSSDRHDPRGAPGQDLSVGRPRATRLCESHHAFESLREGKEST